MGRFDFLQVRTRFIDFWIPLQFSGFEWHCSSPVFQKKFRRATVFHARCPIVIPCSVYRYPAEICRVSGFEVIGALLSSQRVPEPAEVCRVSGFAITGALLSSQRVPEPAEVCRVSGFAIIGALLSSQRQYNDKHEPNLYLLNNFIRPITPQLSCMTMQQDNNVTQSSWIVI